MKPPSTITPYPSPPIKPPPIPTTIFAILRPVITFNYITGLSPCTQTPTGFHISLLQPVIAVTITAGFFYLLFTTEQEDIGLQEDVFHRSLMIKVLVPLSHLMYVLVVLVVYSVTYGMLKKRKRVFEELEAFDAKLVEGGFQADFNAIRRSLRKKFFKLIAIFALFEFGTFSTAAFVSSTILFQCIPLVISENVILEFTCLMSIITTRYSIINESIQKKLADSKFRRIYPKDEKLFEDDLKVANKLHKMLSKLVKELNGLFSMQLLVFVTHEFLRILIDNYLILFTLYSRSLLVKNGFSAAVFYVAKQIGFLLYVVSVCETTRKEAEKYGTILLGIKIDITKIKAMDAIVSSMLQFDRNKFQIMPCKMFPLDYTLIFSICAAAATYLFVMLQFDLDNRKLILRQLAMANATDNATIFL